MTPATKNYSEKRKSGRRLGMERPAHRFPSPDPKVIRHGPFGIPRKTFCVECRAPVIQPSNGRPRILCRKPACAVKRRAHRLEQRLDLTRWSGADLDEARRLWRECALCRGKRYLDIRPAPLAPHDRHRLLPVCIMCSTREPDARALRWLDRCKPGCPLPDPFAKGATP